LREARVRNRNRVREEPQDRDTAQDALRDNCSEGVPDADVRKVRARTLVMLGDRDVVTPEHAIALTRLIPNARLLVLVGGHGDYMGEAIMTQRATRYPQLTAGLVEEFLDEP
jgi:pimeloyl-ACP methyl ester carboxylesterase